MTRELNQRERLGGAGFAFEIGVEMGVAIGIRNGIGVAMLDGKPHIALIGYRACGKTTLGKRLAAALGREWIDLDAYIEARAGSIAQLFAERGEAYFRDLEADCLRELCGRKQAFILSTGGGCILREANRHVLAMHCQAVIYLAASAAVLSGRLARDAGERPSLSGAAVDVEVARILPQREPLYRLAATHVVEANNDIDSLVQHLLLIVEN